MDREILELRKQVAALQAQVGQLAGLQANRIVRPPMPSELKAGVTAQILSNAAGNGKYNLQLYAGSSTAAAAGTVAMPEGLGAWVTALGINEAENGGSGHDLAAGTWVEGQIRGVEAATGRPIVYFRPGGGGGVAIKWGVLAADWTSGNTVAVTECTGQQDATANGGGSWTVYLTSPWDSSPTGFDLSAGDVIGFLPFDTTNKLGHALPCKRITPTEEHQLRQAVTPGTEGFDWGRFVDTSA